MITYDKATADRLCREAKLMRSMSGWELWLAENAESLADQLEAAGAEVERLLDDNHRLQGVADRERESADRSAGLWHGDVRTVEAERDALRAEVERLKAAWSDTAKSLSDACLDCGCAGVVRDRLEDTAPTAAVKDE